MWCGGGDVEWSRYDFEYDDVSGALSSSGPARCLIEVKACAVTHSPAEARFYLTANELDAMRGVQQRQEASDSGGGLPTAFVIVLVASPLHNPQMVRLFVFHPMYGLIERVPCRLHVSLPLPLLARLLRPSASPCLSPSSSPSASPSLHSTARSLFVFPTCSVGCFLPDDPSTEDYNRRSALPASIECGQPCRASLTHMTQPSRATGKSLPNEFELHLSVPLFTTRVRRNVPHTPTLVRGSSCTLTLTERGGDAGDGCGCVDGCGGESDAAHGHSAARGDAYAHQLQGRRRSGRSQHHGLRLQMNLGSSMTSAIVLLAYWSLYVA